MSENGDAARRKVLVVDDNDDVRHLVTRVLEQSGCLVLEAASGESAVAMAAQGLPDLVLMDLRLAGEMDGLEATRRLREDPRLCPVPVVALTGSVTEEDRRQALAAGMNGLIGKPLDITALPAMVEKFILQGAADPANPE